MRRRHRPRIVSLDLESSARRSVLQKIEEELAWAEAYVTELRRIRQFATQPQTKETSHGRAANAND